jgi:hypothetical protein
MSFPDLSAYIDRKVLLDCSEVSSSDKEHNSLVFDSSFVSS